ncbi:S-layer homology domain-containing protein [Fretibacterium sp. OH1220_COT-178]|uniref:S-layer homology domain-containing protein n=1 Tax=Fretibacterium sp. OH1220_COT-178 TaxID=2491047 RepID=UPI000F5F7165|nr:S-layer homology domain-containing protein [Fretibacterium sp. OH1220_COT-178]RRD64457.1 S-layer homology domain-containing protein [Fretibacterium sp. OH1220_COT-178]
MKKFAALVAVAVLFAFAAPVFAATNPFMDVPMNHWAYDAIGQLAAHGVLSGYPDGTYKGKQPTTRYEMASALARALAVVDMTKASKQDVEMLKKLVLEFKDELDALGVKVDNLDKRVSVIEDRLGGWKLSGSLRLDIRNEDNDAPVSDGSSRVTRSRLIFERWFGEDESMKFVGRLDGLDAGWTRFYAEIPFFWDSKLTAGRFVWDLEDEYYLGGATDFSATGGFYGLDSYLTDRRTDGLGWEKSFGMGGVYAYVAHPNLFDMDLNRDGTVDAIGAWGAWELFLMGKLQFTEQLGFDLGVQAFLGDNAEDPAVGLSFDNMWTAFAGLRFNFNDNIALKGLFYHQQANVDVLVGGNWVDADLDSTNAWKAVVDVKQDLLKFTSLWLEYGQIDRGFVVPTGTEEVVFSQVDLGNILMDDLKYWRVGAGQVWNDKWATHLFYYNYDFDLALEDFKEYGLGVQYTYNPNVKFGLNYVKVDWDNADDDDVIRFRTQVSF